MPERPLTESTCAANNFDHFNFGVAPSPRSIRQISSGKRGKSAEGERSAKGLTAANRTYPWRELSDGDMIGHPVGKPICATTLLNYALQEGVMSPAER